MPTLVIMRHAKAEPDSLMQRDFDRMLAPRGLRQVPQIAEWLKNQHVTPDYIVASPAMRTRQTAEHLADQLVFDAARIVWQDDIYEASVRLLMKLVTELPPNAQTVILVGHNPGVSYLAEYLSGADIGNMETCGATMLTATQPWAEWSKDTAKFVWYKSTEVDE